MCAVYVVSRRAQREPPAPLWRNARKDGYTQVVTLDSAVDALMEVVALVRGAHVYTPFAKIGFECLEAYLDIVVENARGVARYEAEYHLWFERTLFALSAWAETLRSSCNCAKKQLGAQMAFRKTALQEVSFKVGTSDEVAAALEKISDNLNEEFLNDGELLLVDAATDAARDVLDMCKLHLTAENNTAFAFYLKIRHLCEFVGSQPTEVQLNALLAAFFKPGVVEGLRQAAEQQNKK